ncbi:hypothetical protein NP493_465g00003 [Ridgeia piscesae]|uniref:Transmembrane protein 267 n=1 Tax=Ridgeia piscesae TaxID=27915 RepID=A0AAD9NRN4_RIDPI|nr:hypothetical protein NP493_465g00003 [Ridgeia piscesae]
MDKWLDIFSPKTIVLELLLVGICILDDPSVISVFISENPLSRAAVDSATHGVIAAMSWLLVTNLQMTTRNLMEVFLSGVLGMVIDIDHFIAAGSLSLNAATSLTKRPFLHNSSLILIIFMLLYSLQQCRQFSGILASVPWIFLLAWTSHHMRDGIRHGLWFAPFGSTQVIPKWLYIGVISLCPLLLKAVVMLRWSDSDHSRTGSSTDHQGTAVI